MVRMIGRFGWLAVVLGACVLSAGLCCAQDDDEAALRAAFAKGKSLQGEGKLKEAAASYWPSRN